MKVNTQARQVAEMLLRGDEIVAETNTDGIMQFKQTIPVRVQRLLDLAAKRGLKVRRLEDEEALTYRSCAWIVSLGKHDWDNSRIMIHWMKFNDRKGPGRITLTSFGVSGMTPRNLRIKDIGIWMQPI